MTLSARRVMILVFGLQVMIALVLVGGDLARALPAIAWPSAQPRFDTPIAPGDQTRRFRLRNTPLAPSPDGNPARPFRSTGDMPEQLEFKQTGSLLTLTGQIALDDGARFEEWIAEQGQPITQARLNSPGGSVSDALDIGRSLRAAGVMTVLDAGDICLSACPYIFAAGTTRQVDSDAQVGVHQHSFGTNSVLPAFLAVEDVQRGQGEVLMYLDRMGIDPLVMQHALVTPPDEIYILLPAQLIEYNLVTDGPSLQ
jgi:hypothetical protein